MLSPGILVLLETARDFVCRCGPPAMVSPRSGRATIEVTPDRKECEILKGTAILTVSSLSSASTQPVLAPPVSGFNDFSIALSSITTRAPDRETLRVTPGSGIRAACIRMFPSWLVQPARLHESCHRNKNIGYTNLIEEHSRNQQQGSRGAQHRSRAHRSRHEHGTQEHGTRARHRSMAQEHGTQLRITTVAQQTAVRSPERPTVSKSVSANLAVCEVVERDSVEATARSGEISFVPYL
jgi:hypothetical protein